MRLASWGPAHELSSSATVARSEPGTYALAHELRTEPFVGHARWPEYSSENSCLLVLDSKNETGEGNRIRAKIREVQSPRITSVDALNFLQEIAAVDEVMELDGFGDDLFRFGLYGFSFLGL